MAYRIISNLYGKHRGSRVTHQEPPGLTECEEQDGRSPLSKFMPYRLQVVTQIRLSDLPKLYQLSPQLVQLIQDDTTGAGLPLLHSSWEIVGDVVHLFNYWHMGHDADSLTRAELRLPDKPAYAKFDRLMLGEVKDIVIPVARASHRPPVGAGRYVYLRAAYRVANPDLAEFQARLEAGVIPFAKDNGWLLGDTFLGITGEAGTIVQMWIIPEHAVSLAAQRLAATHWNTLLRQPPTYKVLEATPVDPILGTNIQDSTMPYTPNTLVRQSTEPPPAPEVARPRAPLKVTAS